MAMSSEQFIVATPSMKLQSYKNDLKRFLHLKASVKLRYAESVDYRDFEPKIKKLLDTHITASEVIRLNDPVSIFDEKAFKQVLEEQGESKSTAAKADMIAHATKKAISERLEQDPAFFEKFSKMIQQAIDDFRAKRISDLDYLNKVIQIKEAVVNRYIEDAPSQLASNDNALALYGILKPFLARHVSIEDSVANLAADSALDIWSIIQRNRKVGFWDDLDAQRRTINEVDDYLYDEVKGNKGVPLTTREMDDIISQTMQLARYRMAN